MALHHVNKGSNRTSRYQQNIVAQRTLRTTYHPPEDLQEWFRIEEAAGNIDPNAQQSYSPVILKGRIVR